MSSNAQTWLATNRNRLDQLADWLCTFGLRFWEVPKGFVHFLCLRNLLEGSHLFFSSFFLCFRFSFWLFSLFFLLFHFFSRNDKFKKNVHHSKYVRKLEKIICGFKHCWNLKLQFYKKCSKYVRKFEKIICGFENFTILKIGSNFQKMFANLKTCLDFHKSLLFKNQTFENIFFSYLFLENWMEKTRKNLAV